MRAVPLHAAAAAGWARSVHTHHLNMYKCIYLFEHVCGSVPLVVRVEQIFTYSCGATTRI